MKIVFTQTNEIITSEDIQNTVDQYPANSWQAEAATDWFQMYARDVPDHFVDRVLDLRKDIAIGERQLREVYDNGQ